LESRTIGDAVQSSPVAIVKYVRFVGPDRRERDRYMTDSPTMTSEPQRLRALERANEVRLARAELKRRIADGNVSAAEVILDCPPEADSWEVGELLMSQRRWGRTRCFKFLNRNQISEVKPVGKLTERQRQMLAAQLQLTAPPVAEFATCGSAELLVAV
jgi:hypothetical protein